VSLFGADLVLPFAAACVACVCICVFVHTGKTMLAKAVAHHTTAAFIRVVGSEFVQKYLGEVSTHGSAL
jgi:AAA+ superfamily predicted ATPase